VKFKLDENFGTRTQGIFKEAGHEVHTVRQESLQGTPDEQLYEVCRAEGRCLLTAECRSAGLHKLTFTCFRGTLICVEDTMETQNITLSIPKETLLKVKLLAVKRQTSVSGLLTQTLERLVQQEDVYVHARQRHLGWLEQSVDLGTGGQISTRRDELHERI
jgi:predicted nuclease of predicted toxin-antitoxin system